MRQASALRPCSLIRLLNFMLPPFSTKNQIATVLAVGLCAIGLAWVLEPTFVPASILARLGLLVAGIAAAIANFVLLNVQFVRDSGGGRKYIEALSQIDPALTTPKPWPILCPSSRPATPWRTDLRGSANAL